MKRSRMLGAAALLIGAMLLGAMPGCAAQQERGLEGQGLARALATQGYVVTEFCFENTDGVDPQDPFDNRTAPVEFALATRQIQNEDGETQNELVLGYVDSGGGIQIEPASWRFVYDQETNKIVSLTLQTDSGSIIVLNINQPYQDQSLMEIIQGLSAGNYDAVLGSITVVNPGGENQTAMTFPPGLVPRNIIDALVGSFPPAELLFESISEELAESTAAPTPSPAPTPVPTAIAANGEGGAHPPGGGGGGREDDGGVTNLGYEIGRRRAIAEERADRYGRALLSSIIRLSPEITSRGFTFTQNPESGREATFEDAYNFIIAYYRYLLTNSLSAGNITQNSDGSVRVRIPTRYQNPRPTSTSNIYRLTFEEGNINPSLPPLFIIGVDDRPPSDYFFSGSGFGYKYEIGDNGQLVVYIKAYSSDLDEKSVGKYSIGLLLELLNIFFSDQSTITFDAGNGAITNWSSFLDRVIQDPALKNILESSLFFSCQQSDGTCIFIPLVRIDNDTN